MTPVAFAAKKKKATTFEHIYLLPITEYPENPLNFCTSQIK
jgi:hypothetical protein